MKKKICLALSLAAAAGIANAAEGSWLVRAGVHDVDPKSDNGTVAGSKLTVSSSVRPTFNLDYYFTPNVAVDLLVAVPYQHDIKLNGATVGSVRQLPPTLSMQYHFMPESKVHPFVGAGLNYTRFFDANLNGGGSLALDNSFGFAGQAGVDAKLGNGWLIGADVRYMSIDSKVHVNGADAGTAHIDPLACGVTMGYRF